MINTNSQKIEGILSRGVSEIIEKESLQKKLQSGRQLRVKFGIDPTSPDLHLGHAVVLRKLKQFQDLGHKIILIIGDFTGRIGDPSSKFDSRKPLTPQEIKKNLKGYFSQAGKIINIKNTDKKYNDKWFDKEKIIELATIGTVQQMTERADFAKRMEGGNAVRLIETLYPLFQGYDSVAVKADVELGGTDQKFNLLTGRALQRHYGEPQQEVMMLPLLEGTDGVKKMSKSFGNYIGLNELPKDMFGKIMSIKDDLIFKYIELLTDLSVEEIKKLQNPRDQKAVLAKEIVRMYNTEKEAQKAEEEFNKTFRDKEFPSDVKKMHMSEMPILELLESGGLVSSKSEAKRLILQGAVKIDGVVQGDWQKIIKPISGMKIQVGPRRFLELI